MRILSTCVLLLFVISCGEDDPVVVADPCIPQTIEDYNLYDNPEEDCFELLYADNFAEVDEDWERGIIENADVYFENNRFVLDNSEGISYVICNECYPFEPQHFQIEFEFTIVDFNSVFDAFGVTFGGARNRTEDKHYRVGLEGDGNVRSLEYEDYPFPPRQGFDFSAEQAVIENGVNKMTFRKIYDHFFVFINEKFYASYRGIKSTVQSNEITFRIRGDMKVEVKSFKYWRIIR